MVMTPPIPADTYLKAQPTGMIILCSMELGFNAGVALMSHGERKSLFCLFSIYRTLIQPYCFHYTTTHHSCLVGRRKIMQNGYNACPDIFPREISDGIDGEALAAGFANGGGK
jgi:hypothetical protein